MDVREKIKLFPHSPGVYRYYDSEGRVIYVGKAKDLHKRVAQYFVPPERLNAKTRLLVSRIADVRFSVVDSEADALLLENNLIKQYKPKYNILLKDSKTYPWICVTDEPFPRVFMTRRVEKNGSQYFGPYSSVIHARRLMEFILSNYHVRSCRYRLDSDTVLRKKIRPCLDFHIGKCLGCCAGGISNEEYDAGIREIVSILKGHTGELIQEYRKKMNEASDALLFEQALRYKERLDSLQAHYSKSIITAANGGDTDVFSVVSEGFDAFGNFLRIRGGAIVQSLNMEFRLRIEEDRATVLSTFIAEIESSFGQLSKEVIVPFKPDVEIPGVIFHIPVRGDKLSLLSLSAKNAEESRSSSVRQKERINPDEYHASVLEELRRALDMDVIPEHMECFDNSNIQGTNPVAACVVFRHGVPSKSDYRKFKVKTVIGADDYATMKEIVNRRYSRMLRENPEDLPQLVVIDGGRGQLNYAWQALQELGLAGRFTVVGLAERLEEVIRVGDPYPLFIDRNSQALKLLQHIRDEAHRFGITFHRSLRSKAQIKSALTGIKGVGPQTERRLLLHFGSVARIAAAPVEQLADMVGPALAGRIHESLCK
ncbi:MAG: excinuclease ABC subunit UvrC [Bacteroidales bacterium]|nr:excinuclease ABC subunit UvrC [Bacteroidales bacterium]